jgi:hypothetical protein
MISTGNQGALVVAEFDAIVKRVLGDNCKVTKLFKKLRDGIKVQEVVDKLDGKKTWWVWVARKLLIREP